MTNTLNFYTLRELAQVVHKSPALLYRRLSEVPQRYKLRHARKEGGEWVFPRDEVDISMRRGESIIEKIQPETVALTKALGYFSRNTKAGVERKKCKTPA